MKAVIMAGGDGKRLRPLTCTKPKPLIPLLNRPILDYTMDLLAKHNINEAVFTLHYLGDMIKKTYRKRRSMGNFRKLFGAWQKTRHRRERPCGFGRDFSWEYLRRRIFRRSNCSKRGGGERPCSER